jgi:serine/threonine protein kinase/Flp pilus assembly protein TadD
MKYCPRCQQSYAAEQRFCLEDGELLSLRDPYHLVGRTLVDKYQIRALIGIGGMGAVYSAHHLGIDRRVAIKILQPNIVLGNEHLLGLFEREAKMAGQLMHENIANVLDAGRTTDGIAYIAMEWLEGRTLEEELTAYGPMTFERAARILRQICAALDAAHAAHIIHRDLKPSNIMLVRRADRREQVKVLDFGIAKVISEHTASPVSAPMGTPHYASPEQFQPGAHIDGCADIYSLGVMLYQMLTGALPYNTTSVHELIQLQLTAPPTPLRELRPETPAAVEQLVNRLLAKDPKERPQRASEIPALFEQALRTEPGLLPESERKTPDGITPRDAVVEAKLAQGHKPSPAADQVSISDRQLSLAGRLTSHPRIAAGAALAIIALVIAGIVYWQRTRQNSVAAQSLLIVSFENLSQDRELDRLERIAPELLTTKLAQVSGLEIATGQRMYDALKAIGKRPGDRLDQAQAFEAARRAGAGSIVTGSIIKVGARLGLTARVEEVARGRVIFSDTVEGERGENIFEMADQLAARIARAYRLNAESLPPVTELTTRSYDAYGFYQAGYDQFLAHDFKNAVVNLDKATRIDPNFALAYVQLGRALRQMRDPAAAEAFTKAMELRARANEHDRMLIEAYYQQHVKRDRAKAIETFEQLLVRYPKDKEALLFLIEAYRSARQYDRSIEYGNRALALDASFGAALNAVGYSYLLKHDHVNAIKTFKRYAEVEPRNPNPADSLGDTYTEAGLYDEALESYQRVFALQPDFYDYSALWKMGEVYFVKGDRARAAEYAERFIRNTKESERRLGYQTLARVDLYAGRLAGARANFARARASAARAGSKDTEAQVLLDQSELLMGLRMYDEALRLIGEARRLQPDQPTLGVYNRLTALALRGDFEEAQKEFAQLSDKSNALDFELRARASYAQRDYTTAITLWQKLLEQQPAIVARKYDLALAYLGAGQAAEAERALQEFIKSPPVPDLGNTSPIHPFYDTRYILAHYELARASEALGKRDQAVKYYQRFLEHWDKADFKMDEMAEARQRLGELVK